MVYKKIGQREFVIEVCGPLIYGEYGFTIKFDLDGLLSKELFNSVTDKVGKLKTLKIACEIASFAAREITKFAADCKSNEEYFQKMIQLTETINNRLKKKKPI